MPGTIIGALIVDRVGAKRLLIIALVFQGVVGFLMSGLYTKLTEHIAAFAVVYGIFLAMGEVGPGNCIGLLAAKSSATAVRGRFYGTAAAFGKIGAYVGTWAFPALIADFPATSTVANTGPFYLGSGMAILSAVVTYFLIKPLSPDQQHHEDIAFKEYLIENGYDISQMGLMEELAVEGTQMEYSHENVEGKHHATRDQTDRLSPVEL
jgi:MFS family permease